MYVAVYKSGNFQYVRVMRSIRGKDGKVKSVVVKNLGRKDLLEANDPDAIAKLRRKYGGTNEEKLKSKTRHQQGTLLSLMQSPAVSLPASFPVLNYGHLVLKRLWNEILGMNRRLDYLQQSSGKTEFDFNAAVSFLTFSKVLDPHSVKRTFAEHDFLLGDPARELSLSNCYDTLSMLRELKDKIFHGINLRLDELYGTERSLLLFYDVTNVYFESPLTDEEREYEQVDFAEQLQDLAEKAKAAGDLDKECFDAHGTVLPEKLPAEFWKRVRDAKIRFLKMRGPSKEHRFDLPIVSVALIIDGNGFPIDFEVYAGNASEFKTMVSSVTKLKHKYHAQRAILVADRGLNSATNLQMLQQQDLGFLMAQKVSSFSGDLLKQMLSLDDYELIDEKDPEFGKYRIIENFPKINPNNGEVINCTLMLTYNEKRRKRDEAILDLQVAKVKAKAAAGEKLGPSLNSWADLALTDSKKKKSTIVGVDTKVENRRRERCGFAAMVFKNAPSVKDTPAKTNRELAGIYHSLNRIEECFKIMKNNLGLRPMFVWQSDHIRGHITVCVLALLMIRLLQRKLKDELSMDVGIDSLCQALNEANVTLLRLGEEQSFFIPHFSKVDHVRRGREQLSTEELMQMVGAGQSQPRVIDECMKAVGLTPITGIMDRRTLASCLKTHYATDEDAVSPLLLKECDGNSILHSDEK